MQMRWIRVPRSRSLERAAIDVSPKARQRLRWFDYYRAHEGNAALTCRYFGISRQTFYRWKRRYDPHNLKSLEDGLHRPHRRRQPTWSPLLAERGLKLFVLPPRSPQLNGAVERAQRTHTEEFYEPAPRDPARSRSPSSTRNSRTGSGPPTPSAPTKPLATELPRSSSPKRPPHPNLRSVTNLLDEYNFIRWALQLIRHNRR
jgi:hypothetical protein